MNNAAVSKVSTTTTTDEYGDATTGTVETPLSWAIIAPRSSDERTDSRAPAVITAAVLYGPVDEAPDTDDTLVVSGHSAAMDGTWQVEGTSGAWVSPFSDWRPGFEVALKRAG